MFGTIASGGGSIRRTYDGRLRRAAARYRRIFFEPLESRALLAPLVNIGTDKFAVFQLPATATEIVIEDDGIVGNDTSQIRSVNGAFDTTLFSNAFAQLKILRGSATGTVSVRDLPDPNNYLQLGDPGQFYSSINFTGISRFGLLFAAATNINIGADVRLNTPNTGFDLRADNLNLDPTAILDAGTGFFFLNPVTSDRMISVGTIAAGQLSISAAQFNQIQAKRIGIGSGFTDVLTVTAPLALNCDFAIHASGTINVNHTITLAPGKHLQVTAMSSNSTLVIPATGSIEVSGGGSVQLIADEITIDPAATVNAGTGLVQIVDNSGRGVVLGPDVINRLSLTDAELDRIIAGKLQFGPFNIPVVFGTIDVTENITRSSATAFSLETEGAVNFTGGAIDSAGGNVTVGLPAATITAANPGADILMGPGATATFANSSKLTLAVNGLAADTQYHRLTVAGQIDLTGVNLVLSGGYTPAVGATFVLVDNDGAEPIAGTFKGLPEGQVFPVAGAGFVGHFQITYQGGDGNDVVLTAVNAAPAFVMGTDQNANDESGPVFVAGWATAITPGPPGEATQQVHFVMHENTNPELFAVGPLIDAAGNLSFEPAHNVAGTALVTIALVDDGGNANGGSDTSNTQTFSIRVTKAHVWHNSAIALDVTADGSVMSSDALKVINFLNAFGSQEVPADGRATGPYYDVNADGLVSAKDVLAIINHMNAFDIAPGGEPFKQPATPLSDPTSDALISLLALDLAAQPKRRR